jgi:hypothetical protein
MMYFGVGAAQDWLLTVMFCLGLIAVAVAIWWSVRHEKFGGHDAESRPQISSADDEHAEPGVPVPLLMLLFAIFVWAIAVSWLVVSTGVGI